MGMDISERYAKNASDMFHLPVIVTDITQPLPAPSGEMHCVFAFDVLEHIEPEKRPALFSEIDRVLHPTERMIFINNPLGKSQHNPRFDFEFDENDIAVLAKATRTKILEVKLLRTDGDDEYMYQFIVLGSVNAKS